jgi:hypothetical protein
MANISIHNVKSIRMNVKESEIDSASGSLRKYKVITLVSKNMDGEEEHVTFFTDSLDFDLQGSLE